MQHRQSPDIVAVVEPCAGVIVSMEARRSILARGSGAPQVQKNPLRPRRGAAWTNEFSSFAYLFQQFSAKNFHTINGCKLNNYFSFLSGLKFEKDKNVRLQN